MCGRIRDKYNQTGGPNGFLLFPKTNELTNPGNTGKRSEFLGGNIYWSTATDAHPVAHDFLTKWGEKGYESGYLKYPTTDEIVLSDNVNRRQEYQGGTIYWAAGIGAHTIQGAIKDKWASLGSEKSYLAFPTSDELTTPGGTGRYNTFQNGSLYWSAASGAHAVNGPILDQWATDGYEAGKWGFPTGDQVVNASTKTITQQFQGGKMTVSNLNLFAIPASGSSGACNFETRADYVHISTFDPTLPRRVQGKGYWRNIDCPPDYVANTTAQLQSRDLANPQLYINVGAPETRYNQPPSELPRDKAIAGYDCPDDYPDRTYLWRVEVDVDIVGHPDTPEKIHSPLSDPLDCRPDFVPGPTS